MKNTIRLIFTGDFAPLIAQDSFGIDPFNGIRELITDADAHITNLECPLTDSHRAIIKTGPSLKAHPTSIALLESADVSIA